MVLQRLLRDDLLHVGVLDGGEEVLGGGHLLGHVAQLQLLEEVEDLLLGQGHDGELAQAAVGLVGGQDLVVGHLLVVDVQQAPVLQPEDGVRPPVLAVDRVAILTDRQRRDALEQETR